MIAQVTISKKFEITIPKKIREQFNIRPGQFLKYEVQNGILVLFPKKKFSKN